MIQRIQNTQVNGLTQPLDHTNGQGKHSDHYIVCIGASAGGMEAIHELFDHLPQDTGMSFIVIQHLSSEHKSLMAELLSKHTAMKVVEARENTVVEPDCVYVIPNNRNISIQNRTLLLSGKEQGRSPNMAIDIFLNSLANDIGDKAIAIILSGTGTDGTKGIIEIKKAGGLVFVQDPTTAKFDGMPYSAIASGSMDFILSPESIADELLLYPKKAPAAVIVDSLPPEDEPLLVEILNLIKVKTACDFSLYKRPTIIRRLTRRMAFNNYSLSDYLELLRQNEEEVHQLSKEFLVGVTRFFRDEAAFDDVRLKVIPEITKNKLSSDPIKVWIAGCSTGEEVYSLGILMKEHLDRLNLNLDVKLFGSDINKDAIEFASKGCYSQAIASQIPPDLLEKYFTREDNKYRVVSQLRKMIVFSHHDVLKDPPFGKMDLISCRNMLIYVSVELQKRIMSVFNFSLNVGGFLFLGPSENIGMLKDNMVEVSKKWKIYKKVKPARSMALDAASYSDSPIKRFTPPPVGLSADRVRKSLVENVLNRVMEEYTLAGVLVDKDCYIIETFGEYRKYLHLPEKKFDNNLLKMLPSRPSILVGSNFRKAISTLESATITDLKFSPLEPSIRVTIKPFTDQHQHPVALVLFSDQSQGAAREDVTNGHREAPMLADAPVHVSNDITLLQQELADTKDILQKAIEEAETTNEELQSANEELISSNEELQSANEELQSLNEELHTVNAENQLRIKQIIELNDDLNNYFASSDVGQIFLDSNLQIRKYTPAATALVNLIETDIGRPIAHISNNTSYQDLMRDINYVLKTSNTITKNVQLTNNTWYQLKVMPYLREGKHIDGVILTFVDITPMKLAERELKKANKKLKQLNENLLRSNKELEQFAYITSHDLQEPLRKIQTFVDLIERNPDDRPSLHRYLEKITNCASRMSLLINDVLSYSRLIRTDERMSETDLNQTLETVKSDFELLIDEKKAVIKSADLPRVKGFPLQLQQLFANLISNSIKFCERTPLIEITSENVPKDEAQAFKELNEHYQYVKLKFTDNGIGFDQQYAEKVFTIFQRLNHRNAYAGSGIGLALCKRIVENHHGLILVSAVPDHGATFVVYLPAAGVETVSREALHG
jgi:two-component system, chemotaxis family, CheB/CheR fusion protein